MKVGFSLEQKFTPFDKFKPVGVGAWVEDEVREGETVEDVVLRLTELWKSIYYRKVLDAMQGKSIDPDQDRGSVAEDCVEKLGELDIDLLEKNDI